MRRRPLVRSALLLTAAGVFSRGMGTLYRILIVRLAGAEALGLFQMVVPVLRTASTLATLRLPTALTRVIADRLARGDVAGAYYARSVTAALVIALSLFTAAAVLALAPFIAETLLTDPRTKLLVYLLPLAFVPSALTGIFRGFSEGRQTMVATAAGQVAEPLVRLPASLALLSFWAGKGAEFAAAALVVGTGLAEVAGLLAAMALCGWHTLPRPLGLDGSRPAWRRRHRGWRAWVHQASGQRLRRQVAGELLTVALPLWATTMINTGAQLLSVTLIPRRLLAAGFPVRQATELYGQMSGMVVPLLYLPMVLVFPASTVLTPSIAARLATGDVQGARKQLGKALLACLAVGAGASLLLFAAPEPLAALLYGEPGIAPLVQVAAAAPPFVYSAHVFSAVLSALGKTKVLLLNFVLATAVRVALIYWLTADPALGIAGALWAMNVDHALTALLNGWAVWKHLGGFPARPASGRGNARPAGRRPRPRPGAGR